MLCQTEVFLTALNPFEESMEFWGKFDRIALTI